MLLSASTLVTWWTCGAFQSCSGDQPTCLGDLQGTKSSRQWRMPRVHCFSNVNECTRRGRLSPCRKRQQQRSSHFPSTPSQFYGETSKMPRNDWAGIKGRYDSLPLFAFSVLVQQWPWTRTLISHGDTATSRVRMLMRAAIRHRQDFVFSFHFQALHCSKPHPLFPPGCNNRRLFSQIPGCH